MKHKVSDIEGVLLDAAVAKAEGFDLDSDGDNMPLGENGGAPSKWNPSTDWAHAGPIIERERIMFSDLTSSHEHDDVGNIRATIKRAYESYWAEGPTHCIAAMRAYVYFKFGSTVGLP